MSAESSEKICGGSPVSTDGSLTAVEYIETQLQLEKEAREAMPYEPDMCTYPKALRQLVFACLTCRQENNNAEIGVCYSCSIQCHSTHELVELFSKRDFVCDCGTSKMGSGKACAIRSRQACVDVHPKVPRMRTGSFSSASSPKPFTLVELPQASDIESSSNIYNQNFAGKFCSCAVSYNPIKETQTMHQCYLGDACSEDWFHQECILGYVPGTFSKNIFLGSGKNKLEELPPPGIDAASETVAKIADDAFDSKDEDEKVPHFPDMESFGEFICWMCVNKHRDAFDELLKFPDVVVAQRNHYTNVKSAEAWSCLDETMEVSQEPPMKRQKTEAEQMSKDVPYSVFLVEDAYKRLSCIRDELKGTPLRRLLDNFEFLVCEDPIYQPEAEDVASTQASEGSLYDLGSSALSSLPIPQALEGLQAYDTMKEKLRGFFKDFVDQKKVVTEDKVREFFGKMNEK